MSAGLALIACLLAVWGLAGCAGYTSANTKSPAPGGASGTLAASATNLNFGTVTIGNSSTQNLTVTNTGAAVVDLSSASISGAGFTLTAGSGSGSIPPGQNATFQIQFAPQSAGEASGMLTISSDASNPSFAVALSGNGASANSGLSANPESLDFGDVAIGSDAQKTVTLSNSGSTSVTISAAAASGTGFSIAGLATPQTINAGQSVSFSAEFAPKTASDATGSISIESDASNGPISIFLSGTGFDPSKPALMATPDSASFGNVIMGNANSQTISLSNPGNATVTISGANVSGAGVSITGIRFPATIASGRNTTFNIEFRPQSTSSVTGSVSLASNAPNSPLAIRVSGTGIAETRMLAANPGSVNFGNVNVGSSGSSTVSVRNTGNSNVTISSVIANGTGFGASGIGANTTLTPNQSASLNLTFTPGSGASFSGSVTVASNASNSPMTIRLSGTGVAPTPHSASLSWGASPSSDVAGYNVYRSTTSGSGYVKLSSSPVVPTQYNDSTVQSGQTYYYVVTAVDSNNQESEFSNQATAVIP